MFSAQDGVHCCSDMDFFVDNMIITFFLSFFLFQVRCTRLAGGCRREMLPELRRLKAQQLQAKVQNRFV